MTGEVPDRNGSESLHIDVLHLEDSPLDSDLVRSFLGAAGVEAAVTRVETAADFTAALRSRRFDLIIADQALPDFDGLSALTIARREAPETPFIFVSGVLGEEVAIETLKGGATDYVLKQRLQRLGPAVRRAVGEARERAERRRAEEALGERDEVFRLIVENAREFAIFTTDLEGRVTTWNPGAERLLGFTGPEIVGRSGELIFTPEDRAAGVFAAEMQTALRDGRAGDDRWQIRKDGVRFWASGSTMLLRKADGTIYGFLKILRDLTDRKRVEEARQEEARRKDEFLALLAHELRNPLAPVRNALHVLKGHAAGDPTFRALHEMMSRQVLHMTRLIEDLLDVSRLTRGTVSLRYERTDLARLVRNAAEDRRGRLEAGGLELVVDVPHAPVWVAGDPTRLAQVIDNLLDNAGKFTNPGGRVGVTVTATPDGRAAVRVCDTGIGLDAGELPAVFEKFSQAGKGLERHHGGLGLGLFLSKALTELHGGTLEAASPGRGRGAEFSVRLPLWAAEDGRRDDGWQDLFPAGSSGREPPRRRVLLIDDNRDAAGSLRLLLEAAGFQVEEAHTGLEGVEAARKLRPDAVVCDIGLPGLDGYAVARGLRRLRETATLRLIALTGYGQEEDRRRALEAGFDEHLVKPVDPEVLLRHLLPSENVLCPVGR